jgi:hypothetical protein
MSFKEKYLKYKQKYLNLKNQIGGGIIPKTLTYRDFLNKINIHKLNGKIMSFPTSIWPRTIYDLLMIRVSGREIKTFNDFYGCCGDLGYVYYKELYEKLFKEGEPSTISKEFTFEEFKQKIGKLTVNLYTRWESPNPLNIYDLLMLRVAGHQINTYKEFLDLCGNLGEDLFYNELYKMLYPDNPDNKV